MEPTSNCLIITPVCAHQLGARPMVLDPDRVITVHPPRGSRKAIYLSVDGGKSVRLSGGERVEIRRAKRCVRLVRLTQRNFYQVIHEKLGGYDT